MRQQPSHPIGHPSATRRPPVGHLAAVPQAPLRCLRAGACPGAPPPVYCVPPLCVCMTKHQFDRRHCIDMPAGYKTTRHDITPPCNGTRQCFGVGKNQAPAPRGLCHLSHHLKAASTSLHLCVVVNEHVRHCADIGWEVIQCDRDVCSVKPIALH